MPMWLYGQRHNLISCSFKRATDRINIVVLALSMVVLRQRFFCFQRSHVHITSWGGFMHVAGSPWARIATLLSLACPEKTAFPCSV